MDNFDFLSSGGIFGSHDAFAADGRPQPLQSMPAYLAPSGWPLTNDVLDEEDDAHRTLYGTSHQTSSSTRSPATMPLRHNTPTTTSTTTAPSAAAVLNATATNAMPSQYHHAAGLGLNLAHNMNDATLLSAWPLGYQAHSTREYTHDSISDSSYDDCSFPTSLQHSPNDYVPLAPRNMPLPLHVSTGPATIMPQYLPINPMDTMAALGYHLHDNQNQFSSGLAGIIQAHQHNNDAVVGAAGGGSPSSSTFDVCSLSSSDASWTAINFAHGHHGFPLATTHAVFNPGETLHIRTDSNSSDGSQSDRRFSGSYEDMPFPMHSPASEHQAEAGASRESSYRVTDFYSYSSDIDHSAVQSPDGSSPALSPSSSAAAAKAIPAVRSRPLSSSSCCSTSPTGTSPTGRRRRSPNTSVIAKTTKAVIKKTDSGLTRKTLGATVGVVEKRIGRRKGPLRPEQRQQAHEIRKLRACLRCKFLKKTCDKGDPCAGCRPSHARLWQVPCTRIDIKDIGFFVNDWECDFKRHVTLGYSVNNIKGFSDAERTVYITHGFGFFLPVSAREIYVADEKCFEVDWIETDTMTQYEANTCKLTTGQAGVSASKLAEYLDMHLDQGFDNFVDTYFQGTPFLTQILHTAYKYYTRTETPVIRKALKLVLAYTLTVHITMVVGLSESEQNIGRVDDEQSRFAGETAAPGMINFEVKCAMAKMWRELQKDVLEELSGLYSSVYQGDKLRHWPTIFMVASILLAVWELMQFDCHYREPDEQKVDKFCNDMESTPVGVIVGLFQAISQKLPSFMEWDTTKHAATLNNNAPICDALTEVRKHVEDHESYLRQRPAATFSRDNFDSLSNKLLSRLVIRAN